ncbi:DUF1080 domain-containing protein [Halalkalibaculum sp. DA3122]|uniref:DUF1080 domain-containing protein n=1 Tax=Halalkalibaculum sp. DA3122 TaxID=3373607 RepID=UPI003754D3DE
MKRFNPIIVLLLVFAAASCAPSNQAVQSTSRQLTPDQLDNLTEVVAQMPAADKTERDWLNSRILEMGPPAVHNLVDMLDGTATGDDTNARYAVNGLAKFVSDPGNGDGRAQVEQVILEELRGDHPVAVDIFLLEQLELIGTNRSVPLLRSFLGDAALNGPAAHALRSINTEQAANALAEELSDLEGSQKVAPLKALGDMQRPVPALINQASSLTESSDPDTRDALLYALANTGDPGATPFISAGDPVQYRLTLAHRLAEEGYAQQGSQLARDIYAGDHPTHVQTAALTTIFEVEGEIAAGLLFDAVQDPNPELRAASLSLIQKMDGSEITERLVDQLDQSNPSVQADIIEALGKRGDSSAWSEVRPFLRDSNPDVRLAAINASVPLGKTESIPVLLQSLDRADQPGEIKAIQTALQQLPSKPLYAAATQRWARFSTGARVALIEIVGERQSSEYLDDLLGQLGSADRQVRLAILRSARDIATADDLSTLVGLLNQARNDQEINLVKEAVVHVANTSGEENAAAPVIEALGSGSESQSVHLIEILPAIGGQQAMETAIETTTHSNGEIQSAAKTALANWPEADAIQPLKTVIQNTSPSERPALVDGYIRLVRDSRYSDSDKVQFLTDAIEIVSGNEQKSTLLEALSGIQSTASLKAVAHYFDSHDEPVRNEALRSAAEILAPSYNFANEFDGTDKTLAVLEATTDSTTRAQIEQFIGEIQTQEQAAEGFTSLFNGENLSGWTGDTEAYQVRDGQLIHRDGESGNIFTTQEYSDFILRFQFKLTPGANNGLAIRSPLQGNPAYEGMELQILDNTAEKYTDLQPYQYHGSVYGVAPAQRGHLKPVGEWNTQEVIANGSQITVKLNGVTILDTNLEEAATPNTVDGEEHPGLLRTSGHIGFLGHGDEVAFRNIQVRDLNVYYPDYSGDTEVAGGMNHPPEGFTALFNGENLEGWKGLVENPEVRAQMSKEELAEAQKEADRIMQQHWSVRDGILFFDGNGESLATEKDYKDFEMLLDWKIEPGGDSGVYLRGTPQVQIWDITQWPVGSGGLYNNQNHLSEPLVNADNPVGEWNHMRIKMIGERVTVHLNGQLVVPNVVLENYWNRDKPIYPEGQIELQAHNTPLYFKNVFIREIPRTEPLFNGEDLAGWERVGGNAGSWNADDGLLYTKGDGEEWEKGAGGGWLSTTEMYDNFKLELEYRLPEGGNSGVFLRAPHQGDPAYQGLEIQLLDDYADQYAGLQPWQYTGSIYDIKAPSRRVSKPAGEWQQMVIVADGPNIKVTLNGQLILNTSLVNHLKKVTEHPGLKHRKGYIGLQNHNSRVEFRNINITEIK